jgi:uncharacterized protein
MRESARAIGDPNGDGAVDGGTMRRLLAAVVAAACLVCVTGADAAGVTPVPQLGGRVTDTAQVLSADDRASLSKLLADYERETHHQIAVLTIPTLGAEPIEAFSMRVADAWRLGLRGWNNGILVTLAMRERRCRIELGTGMERYIGDVAAKAVINEQMAPEFARQHYALGLRAGLLKLMELAQAYRITDPSHPPDP